MAPLFGDFLTQAQDHVTAAVSVQEELPADARSGVIRELDRLVTILQRYLGDVAMAGEFPQGPPGGEPPGERVQRLMHGSQCVAPLRSCIVQPTR
jgi:hypothetical protein